MDTKKLLPILIVVVVVIGGIAFFGGTKYASGKNNAKMRAGSQAFGQMGAGQTGGNRGAGRVNGAGGAGGFVNGEILSKDAQSITVKLRDGGSKIIFISGTTEVSKFVAGTTDDLAVGNTVMVNGKTNSDGSIAATTIQLRPNVPTPSTGTTPAEAVVPVK